MAAACAELLGRGHPVLWVSIRTATPARDGWRSAATIEEPARRARTPSQPAPASVLAEVTRQLLGRCSTAQLFDVLAFEDRLAIDGILKPFELGLEMLDPRLEPLDSMLPTGVGRSRT
jgi:hypothetical protein